MFILKSYAEQSPVRKFEWQISSAADVIAGEARNVPEFFPSSTCVKNGEKFGMRFSWQLVIENFSWILWGICRSIGKHFLHRGKSVLGGDEGKLEMTDVKLLKLNNFSMFCKKFSSLWELRVLEGNCSPSFWPSVISITIFYSYFASFTININYP